MKLPDDTLHYLVHDVARLFLKLAVGKCNVNLPRSHIIAIAYLSRHQGITQNALSHVLDMQTLKVGRIIDTLVRMGLVEKKKNELDQRAHFLFLTENSNPIIENLKVSTKEAEGMVVNCLNEEECLLLKKSLVKLQNRLREPQLALLTAYKRMDENLNVKNVEQKDVC